MSNACARFAMGREAIAHGPEWPAPSPAPSPILLPVTRAVMRETPQFRPASRVQPRVGRSGSQLRALAVRTDIELDATYNGAELLWALALGRQVVAINGNARPEDLGGGAYRHVIEVAPRLHAHAWSLGDGWKLGEGLIMGQRIMRRSTLYLETQTSVWAALSSMVESLELDASPRGVQLRMSGLAHSLDRGASLGPLALPDWRDILFHELEFRIAPYSTTTALSSADAFDVTGVRVGLRNNLQARQGQGQGLPIGEPKRQALPTVGGRVFLPEHSNETFTTWAADHTVLMAQWRFQGEQIGASGESYRLNLYAPHVELAEASAPVEGAAFTRQSLDFEALTPDVMPAGFPAVVESSPLIVELVTDESTNPFL